MSVVVVAIVVDRFESILVLVKRLHNFMLFQVELPKV